MIPENFAEIILSVIIPVYNREKYIYNAVASVLAASRDDVEIIIIDDCSTDNSYEICLALAKKHKNIVLMRLNENTGPGEARNVGLNLARGYYVYFLDSDDMITTENLLKLLGVMNLKKADLFWLQVLKIQTGRKEILSNPYDEGYYVGEQFLRLFAKCPGDVSGWMFAYGKGFLKRHDIMFSDGFGEDTLFAYKSVFMAETVFNFTEIINCRLVNLPDSLTALADRISNNDRMSNELLIIALMQKLSRSVFSYIKKECAELLKEHHIINIGRFDELFEAALNNSYSQEWTLTIDYWTNLTKKIRQKYEQTKKQICLCPHGKFAKIIYNRILHMGNIPVGSFYDNNPSGEGIYNINCLENEEDKLVLLATGTESLMDELKTQIEAMGYKGEKYSRCICFFTKR